MKIKILRVGTPAKLTLVPNESFSNATSIGIGEKTIDMVTSKERKDYLW